MDKNEANKQLKFGIALLKGKACIQPFKGAIGDALYLRWVLNQEGFWWQSERLENWIHQAQKKGAFL